jgi:predicted lipoprotein with Yx(FWY)xxD motif
MWRRAGLAGAAVALACLASPAPAQNRYGPIPAAASAQLPPGISVRRTPIGEVYVDAQGRVLYGMDMNTLRLDTRTPNKHCQDECLDLWEPAVAPPGTPESPPGLPAFRFGAGGAGGAAAGAGGRQGGGFIQGQGGARRGGPAQPAGPDWTVSEGSNGPQLIYKRTHLVFTRKAGDPKSTEWDGEEDLRWNVLRFVPPEPEIAAPDGVSPLFIDGEYALVDKNLKVLFTADKAPACLKSCAQPFTAGFLVQAMAEWTVARDGDIPQWLYRGKPVYVSMGAPRRADIPDGAALLHP